MLAIPGYELKAQLYGSARTRVYRGRRERDGLPVVLKLLGEEFPSYETTARFKREYELGRRVSGEGAVGVLGLEPVGGSWAIVMEDHGARTLRALLDERRLSLEEALRLGLGLARALAGIHRHGIVHKDINPSNVLIEPTRQDVRLIDFGLASLLPRETPALFESHPLEGTLRYTAPEQTGRMHRAVDHRSDLYSLGVTLYEMLTGEPPFASMDPAELVHLHIAQRPLPPHERDASIARPVSDVVMKLLAKMAEDRYQSALGVEADLRACLEAWESGARDSGLGGLVLRPAQRDLSHRFQLPRKLYGREPQLEILLRAFERAARGRSECVLVEGDSGMGKSQLVHELERPVLDRQGSFLSGKFDQLQRDAAYGPLLQGFSGLVRRMLTASEQQLGVWRQRLSEALDGEGQVLLDVLPLLERILGPQPPVPALPHQEARDRFERTFTNLVRALVSEEHPLVLFLDDVQWADASSLLLLQRLLTEPLPHLLIVCAFPGSEVGERHPVRLMREALEAAGTPVTSLSLGPLEPGHVMVWTAETLQCDPRRSASLARLLWERSGGNPFFLGQLLRALHEEGFIDFCPETDGWTWDVEVIRTRGLTADVIELMTRKIQRLPEATQRVLEVAACIGYRFQLEFLATVLGCTAGEAASRLEPAVEEGLLHPLESAYGFLHDRVQEAAASLLPDTARAELHLRIARMLLASLTPEQREERIIDLVHQLNRGCALVTDEEERLEMARLNLLAGRKARASAEFEPALRYLAVGLSLLPADAWDRRPSLWRELHLEAMEAEYLNGHMERAEALSEQVLARMDDPVEQAKIFETRIHFASARGAYGRILADGARALALLGLELPRKVELPELMAELGAVRERMAGLSREELLNLPLMTDPRGLAACRLTMALTSPLFVKDVFTSLVLSMRMLKLCLELGHAPQAPYFHADYAWVHSTLLGDVETATAHGVLFLALLDRLGEKQLESKVFVVSAAYIQHWNQHLRETLPPLRRAIQAGLDTGDLEFTAYAVIHLGLNVFFVGQPLDEALREYEHHLELAERWKLKLATHVVRSLMQVCLNLMGRTREPLRLVGEVFDEDAELPSLVASGYGTGLSLLYLQKTILAYYFRDTGLAFAMSEAAEPHMHNQLGEVSYLLHHFFQSLALLSACGGASEVDKARFLARVERNQERLKSWAGHAPMNSQHRYQLVEAERARVGGDFLTAARLYEEAAAGARASQYLNEEALCHELAGEFFRSLGRYRLANDSVLDAAASYRRWGAEAKVADLERRFPEAFERQRALDEARSRQVRTTSTDGSEGQLLDLATVLDAAQAISGELVLDRLVERLMRKTIESAGAQRGVLVLLREGQWLIEAEQSVDVASTARPSVPLEGSALLSEAIVHYVARTRESVVLDDASVEGLFTREPYVLEHRLRSVLCAPLITHGRLVAILYLENNHTAGAFTEERLNVLRLLSSQAALSLQNALLYAQMEEHGHTLAQRVEERTRELQVKNQELGQAMNQLHATQRQLVLQEKLASLGAITAGIAHELKNPLNFIGNFADLSVEFTKELVETLAAPQPAKPEELGEVLSELLQSVTRIKEHSQRATQIINGMLLHSRDRSGMRAPAELNAVLAESVEHGYRGFCVKMSELELDLRTDYDPRVGEVDLVVPEISRVFINAVDNACYALRRKKDALRERFTPRLEVMTRDRGEFVEVRLRDNGTGIPEALLGKVFDPFFTTKPAGEGTGLGLSLSHDIVVGIHQGRLRLDSVEGEFTELTIELPRHAPKA